MQKHIAITDAELPIMKALWEKGECTSPEILKALPESKNKSTVKTLLLRLVQKGTVGAREINSRNYMYFPLISKEQYTASTRRHFLDRVFDGSRENMLLNFVKEEKVTREELLRLIAEISED